MYPSLQWFRKKATLNLQPNPSIQQKSSPEPTKKILLLQPTCTLHEIHSINLSSNPVSQMVNISLSANPVDPTTMLSLFLNKLETLLSALISLMASLLTDLYP